jgi:hypothetical protein
MTNNDILPLKRSKQVWIFVGFLLFLVLLLVVSTVVDVVMEDREQARRHLMPAFEVTRESAGEEITHAVGVAVEKYQAILDRQWTNPDCTPDHCADSTNTIPGTPPKRDRVTQEESDLLVLKTNPQKKETREEIMPDPAGPVVSNIQIYSTKKHEDGTVTAVVTVMTYGCQDGKARNFTSDRIMALAPSTTNPRDYIVTRDIRVASTQDQYSYTTLYSYNSRHNEPECA